jgi:hypothetical protein
MSLLDEDLSYLMPQPKACEITNCFKHDGDGVWANIPDFHHHLESTYDFIDLMSFGASPFACKVPVRRAIVGLGGRTHCCFPVRPKKVKWFTNVHAKVVIGYKNETPLDVFVGSANFVAPTLYELMVQVKSHSQFKRILAFYESFWSEDSKEQNNAPKKTRKK